MNQELLPAFENNPIIEAPRKFDMFFNMNHFEQAQRVAKVIAQSNFIPDKFKGNIGDCMIALDIAYRLSISPTVVLQELYIVHGKPAFSSKFLISLINQRGGYQHDLEFEEKSDSCYAWTVNREGRKLIGPTVTLDMAKKEGWYSKNGSKWQTMPQVMLGYRAASFFAKKFCPNLTLGMQSLEELQDIIDITPTKTAELNERIKPSNKSNDNKADQLREALKGTNNEKAPG